MSISDKTRAGEIADGLIANGAVFTYRGADGSMPASFTYALGRGGDRWRCRGLVLDAKADPAIWHELVAEVGRRSIGDAS